MYMRVWMTCSRGQPACSSAIEPDAERGDGLLVRVADADHSPSTVAVQPAVTNRSPARTTRL